MNKSIKTILALWAIILIVSGISSCTEDFLDEELKTQRNTEYFKTPEGIADLADALVQQLQEFFHGQGAVSFH